MFKSLANLYIELKRLGHIGQSRKILKLSSIDEDLRTVMGKGRPNLSIIDYDDEGLSIIVESKDKEDFVLLVAETAGYMWETALAESDLPPKGVSPEQWVLEFAGDFRTFSSDNELIDWLSTWGDIISVEEKTKSTGGGFGRMLSQKVRGTNPFPTGEDIPEEDWN